MVTKLLKAFDATIDFGLTTFKKVVLFAVVAAIIAAAVTTITIILGFNALM